MAKHKKTLEQKKKADMRKQSVPMPLHPTGSMSSSTFSLSNYSFTTPTQKEPVSSYQSISLIHGLEKSLIVSSVIVILELAIFFLLTHHILILPGHLIQY